jgi:hypothetical protein
VTFGTLFAAEIPSVGTCGLPWAFCLKLCSLSLLAVLLCCGMIKATIMSVPWPSIVQSL